MWRNVVSSFDCDYILIVPKYFWWRRDTTFNHTNAELPDYIHGRYILDGSGIRLIEPLGVTVDDRVSEYFRFIPRWRYLRYDRHPISFLSAMVPSGHQVANPFYYLSENAHQEAFEIYRRMIVQIASEARNTIILFSDGLMRKMIDHVQRWENTGVGRITVGSAFPYIAPAIHNSSWGNELVAMAFFKLLTGEQDNNLPYLRFKDSYERVAAVPPALYRFNTVKISFGGEMVGYFEYADNREQRDTTEYGSFFKRNGVAALLATASPGSSIADSCMIPLAKTPENGAELILREREGRASYVIGKIRQLQAGIAIFSIAWDGRHQGHCSPQILRRPPKTQFYEFDLELESNTIATAVARNRRELVIRPIHSKFVRLRGHGHYLAEVASVAPRGEFQLQMEKEDGALISKPILAYERVLLDHSLELIRSGNSILEKRNGQVVIVPAPEP